MATTTTDPLLGLLYINNGFVSARWNFDDAVGTSVSSPGGIGNPAAVSFSFLTAVPSYYSTTGFVAFTAVQKQAARDALALYASIANITFTESAGLGEITFGMDAQSGSAGYAFAPSYGFSFNGSNTITSVTEKNSAGSGGDVWLNSSQGWVASDFNLGGLGFGTLVHEIGHALGLSHPFGNANFNLTASLDNKAHTVMSYTDSDDYEYRTVTGTSSSFSVSFAYIQPETPMPLDILAIQHLYGANMTSHAGADVYTFDPARPFVKTIWDGGGQDTISVSNFSTDCVIDLRAGQYSTIRYHSDPLPGQPVDPAFDIVNNLAIAFGATIENATGGSGNDVLIGNGVTNTLSGGAGNDTYTVNATLDAIVENASAGTDLVKSSATFTLPANVENLTLTGAANINGTGNTAANVLTGNTGNNVLTGNLGNDQLNGGAGIDTLIGGTGNDVYTVDSTTDTITENAGGGTDTVKSSVSFVLGANLEKLTLTGTGVTNGTGNVLSNTLTGNTAANILDGTGALLGVGEKDTLTGGTGADVFVLGRTAGRYYDDGSAVGDGSADYAFIADFTPAQGDKLQLKGTAADYVVGTNPIASLTGVGLYIDKDGSHTQTANDELIGVVKSGVNLAADVNYVA